MWYDINGIVGYRGDSVTFRKLLIILTFTVTMVIVMLLGTSYAWYQFDTAVTPFNNVQTFTDGLDDLAVVFTNDNNINTNLGIPILASEVAEKASKTTFSITPSSTLLSGKEVAYQIELVNLKIDAELTSTSDLKWSLLETIGNGSATTIASGNFLNFADKSLVLKNTTTIDNLDVTRSYEFRIWLEDNGCTIEQINSGVCSSQNNLMGKTVKGIINVSTLAR